MAFQIKDFTSIVASCINWMKTATNKITDYNVGSVARTMIEAPAAEIDELYQQMFIGLKEAIPVATYNSFDFQRLDALAASGVVGVTISVSGQPTLISAGTTFTAPGSQVTYTSNADVTIAAGSTTADIVITAAQVGAAGNLLAGSSFTLSPAPAGFVSASNQAPFTNGTDVETDDERKLRFTAFVQTLARGTVSALNYGLKTSEIKDANGNVIERVTHSAIIEPWLTDPMQPVGLVQCYIHNGSTGASSDLLTLAEKIINGYYDSSGAAVPGWKAAGVKVEFYAAANLPVAVTATLTALPGYIASELIDKAMTAISDYLQSLDIAETAVRSEIIAKAMEVEGVYNFVVSAPIDDTAASVTQKITPGTIAITS